MNVTATPSPGWAFHSWTGPVGDTSAAATTATVPAGGATITASFVQVPYVLTVNISGEGSVDPVGGLKLGGTPVSLTATPAEGWRFANWEGNVADTTLAETTITLIADETVTAVFLPAYTLTMVVEGQGSVSPEAGDYPYVPGTIVPITATPAEGWQFDGWTGDVGDTSSSETTVHVDGDKTVTAHFSEIGSHPPSADHQAVTTTKDMAVEIVLSSPEEGIQAITYSVVDSPANGVLTGSAPNLTYTPNSGYAGLDSFTFVVNNGTASSEPATVTITVEGGEAGGSGAGSGGSDNTAFVLAMISMAVLVTFGCGALLTLRGRPTPKASTD